MITQLRLTLFEDKPERGWTIVALRVALEVMRQLGIVANGSLVYPGGDKDTLMIMNNDLIVGNGSIENPYRGMEETNGNDDNGNP